MPSQGDADGPAIDERGEILFAAAVEALDEGIIVQDPRGKVLRANTSAAVILGIDTGRFRDLADPSKGWRAIREDGSDLDPTELPGHRTSESGEPNRGAIVGIRSPEGVTTWLSINAYPIDLGDERLVVSSFTDITASRATSDALRDSEERTRAILDTAAEGILTTDDRGVVLDCNPAARRILGDGAVGRLLAELVVDAERWAVTAQLAGPTDPPGTAAVVERTFRRDDGTTVPTELAISETPTRDGRLFTCVLHDISERRAFERELEHQATHDALTGLPNRALISAELDAALARGARRERGVGVLFVELGRMSVVTESLGHAAADRVVVAAVDRLRGALGSVVPEETTVARWGGDHLVLVVEDLDDVTRLVTVAAAVIELLDDPYLVGEEEALVRPTVGVTYASVGDTNAEVMIRNAGIAMNRAATSGGGGVEVFDSAMRARVDSRRTLEVALRHGIERGELELYYQPVVEVRSGVVTGFEALARWHHPELGLLLPGSFIPLAEDCGLIIPLGEQLMAQACGQLAAWQRAFPTLDLTVSVNLSGVQLARADLAATVCGALTSSGTDPRGLHLELTETVLLDDVETAASTLDGLKTLGVGLALDDFGTGYSSLRYLCRFPIDVLKVDQSFVSQLGTGTRDASMVSMVVGMAEALSMTVVAEGIETTEQLEALRGLDCRYAQGFLFSEARPAREAERLITP